MSQVPSAESRCSEFADEFADSTAIPGAPFHRPVFDHRRRRVPGLTQHDGILYGRLFLRLPNGCLRDRRVRLQSTSLLDARRELAALRANPPAELLAPRPSPKSRRSSESARATASPARPERAEAPQTLADFAPHYLQRAGLTKRANTAATERIHLGHFVRDPLGTAPLAEIRKADVLAFRDKHLHAGWSPRTANLALTVLRNVLQCARDEGLIHHDPLEGIRPLRHVPRKRPLFTTAQIEHLASVAEATCPRSGGLLADFLRVCAYAGPRCSEAMRLRWSDVHWGHQQLMIGSDGMAKNHEARAVDFNPKLEEVLRSMHGRRLAGAEFLFSPSRKPAQHYTTMRQTLEAARGKAGMPDFGFHDCRHHFVSMAVMSGIDYLTIARWVGHKDGGVLIGKVYGHLSAEHLKLSASRLRFDGGASAAAPPRAHAEKKSHPPES